VGTVACHRTSSVEFHMQAVDRPNGRQIYTEIETMKTPSRDDYSWELKESKILFKNGLHEKKCANKAASTQSLPTICSTVKKATSN
jgi:hypothetical protein